MGRFLPSSPRSDRSDTHTPDPCCLRFTWIVPSCDFGILSPTLWFTPPVFGRVFPSPLSWLRAGPSIFPGPLGARQGPRIFTPRLHFFGFVGVGVRLTGGIGSIPGVVWGACSHCNCVFLLPLWGLFSREGFLCGGWYARWLLAAVVIIFLVVWGSCVPLR